MIIKKTRKNLAAVVALTIAVSAALVISGCSTAGTTDGAGTNPGNTQPVSGAVTVYQTPN